MVEEESKKIFLITGPSGSGKTDIYKSISKMPELTNLGLKRVITCTTRPSRIDEENGIHYHFYDEKRFKESILRGEFLEHAIVYGNHYGSRREDVEKLARIAYPLIVIDVQGALTFQQQNNDCTSIFVDAPISELEKRLVKRATDTAEEIQRRLKFAPNERNQACRFDYVVDNEPGKIENAIREVHGIIRSEILTSKAQYQKA